MKIPPNLKKYVDYINNTKLIPLAEEAFDEDHEPIGPLVRRDLVSAGLITTDMHGGITLKKELRK